MTRRETKRLKFEPETLSTRMRLMLARGMFLLFAPEAGLFVTWIALVIIVLLAAGSVAAGFLLMGGLTLVLALMLAVAAYLPPTKPFREMSTLAARIVDVVNVATGAALFGTSAAYSGVVGSVMSKMTLEEAMSPVIIWEFVWPILMVATIFGASIVGVRLGCDFWRSGHRARLLALGRLRSCLPDAQMRRHFVTDWLASIVVTGSSTGAFVFLGYLAPVIIVGDVYLGIYFAKSVGLL